MLKLEIGFAYPASAWERKESGQEESWQRDAHDQPFLNLAHCGNTDVLVTGDRDLRELTRRLHLSSRSQKPIGA